MPRGGTKRDSIRDDNEPQSPARPPAANPAGLSSGSRLLLLLLTAHWSSEGCVGAGRTGRHLLGAANGRKSFLKIHVKIQIVISRVFACNENSASERNVDG